MDTPGICRFCHATCGLKVTIEHGRVIKLIGDIDNPVYHGYSCVKGRHFHDFHTDPGRVLRPLRRSESGALEPVSSSLAIAAIAERLRRVLEEHGPRAVAMYGGTFSHFCPAGVMLRDAFMDAIGSPMRFSNATIDQPGKPISMALHGRWGAGPQAFADADVCLLIGANPLVSMWGGIPAFNPARRLHHARTRGLKLIVIDPRRTETARKADLHLQCRPGHDSQILAAMLHVILSEGLEDREFLRQETRGIDTLRAAVASFTPAAVADAAGLTADQIVAAARLFATARRGNATSGTGPSMARHGTLMDYLVLVLNSVCGRWVRAGEELPNRGVLFRQFSGIARAEKPRLANGFGEALRVRGLTDTAAGLPTAALADEILLPGSGQIRALFVVGGNPLLSWPNQAKTRRALQSLDLLVVVDPQLSATAKLADFVIGPRFGFETPALTFGNEGITVYGLSIGYQEPYAQYQPALIEPPAGADVLEDWRVFHDLAHAMKLPLSYRGEPIDTGEPLTTDVLLERFVRRSRVPLEEIKRYPHGKLFPDPRPLAEARDADWPYRLELASEPMMEELAGLTRSTSSDSTCAGEAPAALGLQLQLISHREHAVYNSVGHRLEALRKRRPYNPAYLHPSDADRLGLEDGATVVVTAAVGEVRATLKRAADIRPGVIAIAHGFDSDEDSRSASTACLIDDAGEFDAMSGLPRMSALPVTVRRDG